MIDPIQLVVSVLGVALIVGLVWLAAGSKTAIVGDATSVRERLARELPGFQIGALAIDSDGRSAIVQSQDSTEIALLFATGQRITCWSLPVTAIQRAELRNLAEGAAVIELGTGDFSRGRLKIRLADAASAQGLLPGVLRGST